ncbi:DUF6114 domain-containing protein [Streptomyces noursei]|uniref:DUF6114 domain-containing protein n=1 Tax=Streptomyces noursei TaxID=1971 RepID=UPI001965A776|nr:DUF6114 domain-containing protein [Streptomyces noursei]QRX96218.1 hypothetical protein JNO44_40370 [Streptomyces noursei]
MLTFVLGFLAELAKETGSWLDRVLPLPGVRRPLRSWRRRRPFWAGLWAVAGGLELIALPLAPLPLMLKVGIGAMSAVGVGLVLIAGGLFFVFAPAQRMFVSVVTAIASLVSLATTNLGGFGVGCGLGLLGSSMAFGWLPHPAAPEPAGTGHGTEGADGTASATGTEAVTARPKAPEGRGARPPRPGACALTLMLPLALAAGLLTPAPARAADGDPRDAPGRIPLPCLTGLDTGGATDPPPTGPPPSGGDRPAPPTRTARPGEIGAPDDTTALAPPVVVGEQPGPGRATYPVSPYYPTVGATRLAATDALVHGATYLPTAGGGRIKVLWVHAARILADDYRLRVTGPDGTDHLLHVQLDIRDVDVYATYLQGALEIPWLNVSTPRLCLGADAVPANLPLAVRLPSLTLRPVTAGQVLVDAAEVRYRLLGSH